MPAVPPVSEGWPTLSELMASKFDHFRQFADYCDGISGKGEKALEELAQEVRRPGVSNGKARPGMRRSSRRIWMSSRRAPFCGDYPTPP